MAYLYVRRAHVGHEQFPDAATSRASASGSRAVPVVEVPDDPYARARSAPTTAKAAPVRRAVGGVEDAHMRAEHCHSSSCRPSPIRCRSTSLMVGSCRYGSSCRTSTSSPPLAASPPGVACCRQPRRWQGRMTRSPHQPGCSRRAGRARSVPEPLSGTGPDLSPKDRRFPDWRGSTCACLACGCLACGCLAGGCRTGGRLAVGLTCACLRLTGVRFTGGSPGPGVTQRYRVPCGASSASAHRQPTSRQPLSRQPPSSSAGWLAAGYVTASR